MHVLRTDVKTIPGLKIDVYYADGKVDSTSIFKNDMVEDFPYNNEGEYTTVSGRVDKVELFFKSATNKPGCVKNFLEVDAAVACMGVDASEANKADVRLIAGVDMLAYKANGEYEKCKVLPVLKAEVTSFTSDGNESKAMFEIGKELLNVKFIKKHEIVEANFKIASFIYTIPYGTNEVKLRGVNLVGATTESITFDQIVSCGEKGLVVEDTEKTLEEIIADFEAAGEYGGIILPATSYTEELTVAEDMTIVGANDVPANEGARCTDAEIEGETVITNNITCTEGTTVTVSGLTVNGVAKIQAGGAKELVLKNCRFFGIEGANSQFIEDSPTEEPVLLKVENCYFGNNSVDTEAKTNIYNLINMHCKLADGSYVKNCYFAKEVCSHNVISVYDCVEGATITITDNTFEKSANAVSITLKGEPKATIIIENNEYFETDVEPKYAGLVLIQPNGTTTSTYEGVEVHLNNNKMPEGETQLYYVYSHNTYTQITHELAPKVFIDGVQEERVVLYLNDELVP